MYRNLTLVRNRPSHNVLSVCKSFVKFASVVFKLLLRHDFDVILTLTLGVGTYLMRGTHRLTMLYNVLSFCEVSLNLLK